MEGASPQPCGGLFAFVLEAENINGRMIIIPNMKYSKNIFRPHENFTQWFLYKIRAIAIGVFIALAALVAYIAFHFVVAYAFWWWGETFGTRPVNAEEISVME